MTLLAETWPEYDFTCYRRTRLTEPYRALLNLSITLLPGCDSPLGMGDKSIPDSQITAASEVSAIYIPTPSSGVQIVSCCGNGKRAFQKKKSSVSKDGLKAVG